MSERPGAPDAEGAMRLFRPDERRHARRFHAQLPARLKGILVYNAGGDDAGGNLLRLSCRTRDVSEAGLALVVPAGRLDERFLPRESCLMLVLLDLPEGQVALEAAPMHHQLLADDEDGSSYLIGASIRGISERDRARYLAFLDTLAPAG
ncbi:MAG TPA: PilZ domain-containing protein [Pyrinomonadaceae bacterium]|nr:PilZ domain-containing protein [Pyrinomonadaceae bacterium]